MGVEGGMGALFAAFCSIQGLVAKDEALEWGLGRGEG
jgi:hypothetical protein